MNKNFNNKERLSIDRECKDFMDLTGLSHWAEDRLLERLDRELWNIGFRLAYWLDEDSRDKSDFNIKILKIPEEELKDFQKKLRSIPLSDPIFDNQMWCNP